MICYLTDIEVKVFRNKKKILKCKKCESVRTSRKRWRGKRSPAGWAGRTVWRCRTEEVFQFASPRTGSSEPCLNPGSKREIRDWPSDIEHVTCVDIPFESVEGTGDISGTRTCSLPHSLHLKHPTQSMILEMFLKVRLKSSWWTDE